MSQPTSCLFPVENMLENPSVNKTQRDFAIGSLENVVSSCGAGEVLGVQSITIGLLEDGQWNQSASREAKEPK